MHKKQVQPEGTYPTLFQPQEKRGFSEKQKIHLKTYTVYLLQFVLFVATTAIPIFSLKVKDYVLEYMKPISYAMGAVTGVTFIFLCVVVYSKAIQTPTVPLLLLIALTVSTAFGLFLIATYWPILSVALVTVSLGLVTMILFSLLTDRILFCIFLLPIPTVAAQFIMAPLLHLVYGNGYENDGFETPYDTKVVGSCIAGFIILIILIIYSYINHVEDTEPYIMNPLVTYIYFIFLIMMIAGFTILLIIFILNLFCKTDTNVYDVYKNGRKIATFTTVD